MTEIPLHEHPVDKPAGGARHVAVAGQLQEKKKKDVNFTNFPGFRAKELPELPGQLEAPQLLHRITKAQDFNVSSMCQDRTPCVLQNISIPFFIFLRKQTFICLACLWHCNSFHSLYLCMINPLYCFSVNNILIDCVELCIYKLLIL